MQDASHQRAAISGATRSEHAGNISASEEASIKAKARAKLGETSGRSSASAHGDCPGGEACKAAMGKMDHGHMHRMAMDAHAGKFGPEAQQAAQQAMQSPAEEPDGDEAMPPKRSMFSGDNDEDDQTEAAPVSTGSMFSGGR